MATKYRQLTLVEEYLISGSAMSDSLRTAMGAFASTFESSAVEFGEKFIYSYSSPTNQYYIEFPTDSDQGFQYLYSNYELIEDPSSFALFNSYTMPCRLVENLDFGFEDNDHWRAYLFGGNYGDEEYQGYFFPGTVFEDHSINNMALPYAAYDSNMLDYRNGNADYGCVKYNITPYYIKHYPQYNDYIINLSTEKAIPNAYIFQSIFDNADTPYAYTGFGTGGPFGFSAPVETYETEKDRIRNLYGNNVWRYISLEERYPNVNNLEVSNILNEVTVTDYLPDIDSANPGPTGYQGSSTTYGTSIGSYQDIDFYLRQYFSSSLPVYASSVSESVYRVITDQMNHVIFDQKARNEEMKTISDNIDKFPMYFEIKVPSLEGHYGEVWNDDMPTIKKALNDSSYGSKFMSDLKDAFSGLMNTNDDKSIVKNIQFKQQLEFATGSIDSAMINSSTSNLTDVTLRTVDFTEFINYSCINNNNLEYNNVNCFFVGPLNTDRRAAKSTSATYRHYNSVNFANFFSDLRGVISTNYSDSFDKGMSPETALGSVYGMRNQALDEESVGSALGHKYTEVLAYRIEKISGTSILGGQPEVLQNFWIIEDVNPIDSETLLYDTQIRADKNYTYNIYAYVLIVGQKYKITNPIYSVIVGNVDELSEDYPGYYCIQWRDEFDAPATPLYDQTHSEALQEINPLADETTGISAPDDYKFMVDYNLSFEPSIKILEIPIGTKTSAVIDNPPNRAEVSPFQIMDNSQRIGFEINYSSFKIQSEFPSPIDSSDIQVKREYLHSKDLLGIPGSPDLIKNMSISKQRYVEVYRLDYKPNRLMEFENRLISTIDLKEKNEINYLPQTYFYDKIHTNVKYYYLFRFINDIGVPGEISEILEIELIDDGSFKYSVIDGLTKEDLPINQDIYTKPSEKFKKLFSIMPAQQQMSLNASDVDYSENAASQVTLVDVGDSDLLESIWGERFKFRLISKKTGKMIDINIKYNIITNNE